MVNNRFVWIAFIGMVILFGLSSCGSLRGEPVLPQEVVNAIAQESVKFFTADAPEGSRLIETAKLETYWGQLVPSDEEKYADVICFKAEIKFVYQGYERVTYYQGIVKKPKASGTPWFVDDVSLPVWEEYNCNGVYLVRVTPTSISEP